MRVKALKNRETTYLSIMVNDFVQLGTWYNFIPSQNYLINSCKIVKLIVCLPSCTREMGGFLIRLNNC